MFKNMLKRSWLSVRRKPSRSLILVVILFVMANMLLATISINNSVTSSTDFAKEQIGGTVYFQPDTEGIRDEMRAARESGETIDLEVPTISEETALVVADSEYVDSYTYSVVASVNASGYEIAQTAQNEREQQFEDALNSAQTQVDDQVNSFNAEQEAFNAEQEDFNEAQTSIPVGPGGGGGERGTRPNFSFNFNLNFTDPELNRGDTQLEGIGNFSYASGAEDGSMKVVEGSAYDPESSDQVVISTEVADLNDLTVGEQIGFANVDDESISTFTVVGIYQTTTEDFNYNTVYTSIAGAKMFITDTEPSDLSVQNVRYYLTSAEDKDAFLADINTKYPDLEEQNLLLDVDDEAYQTMVGPIESVGSFATTVQWIVIIATLVIISLIIVINIKDRRYEMGVLLSLGARRTNILGQILIEIVVVGTIGFMLSLGTSQLIAQNMGESLLEQQITATEEAEEETQQFGPGALQQDSALSGDVEQIDEIDVSAGAQEYITLFGLGYMILLVAMIVPSVNILRYQPKTILTGKE